MSWPAMSLYLPSRRKPVRRTTIRRGFSFWRTVVGSSPSFSSTPGRKGSIRMSVVGIRAVSTDKEDGVLRSMAMLDLYEVRLSDVGCWPGRSTRRTEAP